MSQQDYEISAPALDAARMILRNFTITQRGKLAATEKNLAILIDVSTQSFRVEKAMDVMIQTVPWNRMDRDSLAENLDRMREAVRAVELVRNQLPRYTRPSSPPIWTKQGPRNGAPTLSRARLEELGRVQAAIRDARTVDEEQRILIAAGIVRRR